jgi:tRNA threonylcarbamoyladenosine biosynthesis protein TsaB
MLLLAIDTSGRDGSVALAQAGEHCADVNHVETVETVPLSGGTFSAQLVPQIAALLAQHSFTRDDIGAFAVASGPGSFTGLRVGLAAIKALAEILGKPIAAVSLLEVVALAGGLLDGPQGKIMSLLDAGRGEVYAGEYEVAGDVARRLSEQLLSMSEFLARAQGSNVLTPDVNLAAAARAAGLPVSIVDPISAAAIARLGWRRIHSAETVTPEQLEANYIRRSDAEVIAKIS